MRAHNKLFMFWNFLVLRTIGHTCFKKITETFVKQTNISVFFNYKLLSWTTLVLDLLRFKFKERNERIVFSTHAYSDGLGSRDMALPRTLNQSKGCNLWNKNEQEISGIIIYLQFTFIKHFVTEELKSAR